MSSVKNTDKKTRKFISIPDMEKWELIDKLAALPKYEKSFNKIINDALDYGLPLLIKAEFGEVKADGSYVPEEPQSERYKQRDLDLYYRLDELLEELIGLVEETMLNVTLGKSAIFSLFNMKVHELHAANVLARSFQNGDMRDTPNYLENYERRILREIDKRRKKE